MGSVASAGDLGFSAAARINEIKPRPKVRSAARERDFAQEEEQTGPAGQVNLYVLYN